MRAVVCDLGGVVVRIDATRTHRAWAELTGASVEAARRLFPGPAYEALERDEVTPEAYIAHVRAELGGAASADALMAAFCDIYDGVDEGAVAVLEEIRDVAGVVVALTNTNRAHRAVWAARCADAMAVFDAVHCSHELGARKPEPAAFHRVLDAHDLRPEEAVFIDDVRRLVDAASEVGMTGVHFTQADQLREDLAGLDWASR